jgi:hypothetical protein
MDGLIMCGWFSMWIPATEPTLNSDSLIDAQDIGDSP